MLSKAELPPGIDRLCPQPKTSISFLDSYKNLLRHKISNLAKKLENLKHVLRFHNSPEKWGTLPEITQIYASRHESACSDVNKFISTSPKTLKIWCLWLLCTAYSESVITESVACTNCKWQMSENGLKHCLDHYWSGSRHESACSDGIIFINITLTTIKSGIFGYFALLIPNL